MYSIDRIYIRPIRTTEVNPPQIIPKHFKLVESAEAEKHPKQSAGILQIRGEKKLW